MVETEQKMVQKENKCVKTYFNLDIYLISKKSTADCLDTSLKTQILQHILAGD